MAVQPYDAGNFDPFKLQEQSRTVAGIVKTGAVTFDVDFMDPNNRFVYGRFIYVGATGNLAYVKPDGLTESLPNVAAGIWHPIFATRILSAGTSIAASMLRWGM